MNNDAGSALQVSGLSKIFFNTQDGIAGGVSEADFALAPGALFTLLGPSGRNRIRLTDQQRRIAL